MQKNIKITLLCSTLALITPSVAKAVTEPLPTFTSIKLVQDVLWALYHGYDPFLVVAHIRTESGLASLDAGISRPEDNWAHTVVRSPSGDYGRHQVNCRVWKARQRLWKQGDIHYADFPQTSLIEKCDELYNDYINRIAYYYILYKNKQLHGMRKKMYGIPIIFGHYNSGFEEPDDTYMKRLSYHYRRYKRALIK